MLWKCCTPYASKFGKRSSGHKTGKGPVFIPIPKKGPAKEFSNYCTIVLVSHASKVMLNNMWTENFQIYKLDLEKAEEPGNKLPMSVGSTKKQKDSRKTSTSVSLTRLKPWLCGSEQTVENSSRVGNTSPPYLPPEKSVYRSRSNRSGHRTKGWLKIR